MKPNSKHRSWQNRVVLLLAVAASSLACKGSGDAPAAPPNDSAAGAGGASEPHEGDEAGASAMAQGGTGASSGLGEGGDINMPGVGGAPTEPGSWDESFWDEAVWQ